MIDMSEYPVIVLTLEQPGSDDLWLEVKEPVLRAIAYAAIEQFKARAAAASDTSKLDWDDINANILAGYLGEYQQQKFFENAAANLHKWLENPTLG